MVEQWNSGTVWCNSVSSVVEQCGKAWWNSGTVWHSVVEECGTVLWSSGTVWWKSVAHCGGTVWSSMVEQWNSVVQQCDQSGGTVGQHAAVERHGGKVAQSGTVWWNSEEY